MILTSNGLAGRKSTASGLRSHLPPTRNCSTSDLPWRSTLLGPATLGQSNCLIAPPQRRCEPESRRSARPRLLQTSGRLWCRPLPPPSPILRPPSPTAPHRRPSSRATSRSLAPILSIRSQSAPNRAFSTIEIPSDTPVATCGRRLFISDRPLHHQPYPCINTRPSRRPATTILSQQSRERCCSPLLEMPFSKTGARSSLL